MPNWYPLVRAAQALNCPPWELLERSTDWLNIGLALIEGQAMLAEHQAKEAAKRPQRPQRRR